MTRRVVVALIVLAAASAALVLLDREEAEESREERQAAAVLRFDDRRVRALSVGGAGVEARFERSGAGWRMTAPVADAAESDAVDRLLRATRRSSVLRVIEEPEALSAYGLDPPAGSVRVEGEETVPRLDLGLEDPTRTGVFARIEGRSGVLLLGYPEALALLKIDPNRLRDRTLTGVLKAEVVAATVERGGVAVRLVLEGGGWWIVEPARLPASDQRVETLLNGLERIVPAVLEDDAFPPDTGLGLSPPALRVVLETATTRRELRFGPPGEAGYLPAVRDDRETLMRIEPSKVDGLPLDLPSLVDTKLTKANRYDVTWWEDTHGPGGASAGRSGEAVWTAADGTTIAEDRVLSYLARVLEAPVSSVEFAAAPPSDPRAIRFRLSDGSEDRIRVHPERVAALDSLAGIVFRLKDEIPPPPAGQ